VAQRRLITVSHHHHHHFRLLDGMTERKPIHGDKQCPRGMLIPCLSTRLIYNICIKCPVL